jgi:hypothetical protein
MGAAQPRRPVAQLCPPLTAPPPVATTTSLSGGVAPWVPQGGGLNLRRWSSLALRWSTSQRRCWTTLCLWWSGIPGQLQPLPRSMTCSLATTRSPWMRCRSAAATRRPFSSCSIARTRHIVCYMLTLQKGQTCGSSLGASDGNQGLSSCRCFFKVLLSIENIPAHIWSVRRRKPSLVHLA